MTPHNVVVFVAGALIFLFGVLSGAVLVIVNLERPTRDNRPTGAPERML